MNARNTNWIWRLSPKRILLLSGIVAAGVLLFSIVTEFNRIPPPYLRHRGEEAFSLPEAEHRQPPPPPQTSPPGNIFESPALPARIDSPQIEPPPPPESEIPEVTLPTPTPTPQPPPTPVPEPRRVRLRYSGMITRINRERRALLTDLETGTDHLLATGEKWEQWILTEMTPGSITFEAPDTVHTLELGQPFEWVQP